MTLKLSAHAADPIPDSARRRRSTRLMQSGDLFRYTAPSRTRP